MRRLSNSEAWDRAHARRGAAGFDGQAGVAESWLARLRGPRYPGSVNSYTDCVLWEHIYPAFLPRTPGLKVLEVGSAPGEHLIAFHRRFGYEPYGVDYSEVGVRLNRELFAGEGISPDRVVRADFFDEDFLARFRESFDIVVSRGFIEHFDDPAAVVARHSALLKPGGILVVGIPNLTGLNYSLARFFDAACAATHNRDIMRLPNFRRLFDSPELVALHCGYLSLFDGDLFQAPPGTGRERLRRCAKAAQLVLNLLFRFLDRKGALTHPAFSPYLLFIGRKRAGA